MDENESKNQPTENQELNFPEVTGNDLTTEISASDIAELEADFANHPQVEIKWRHPQQILTNKEAQILLSKKEEELTEVEKTALKWLVLRLRHHNSTPKKVSSTKQNTKRKLKRRMSKVSRKANR